MSDDDKLRPGEPSDYTVATHLRRIFERLDALAVRQSTMETQLAEAVTLLQRLAGAATPPQPRRHERPHLMRRIWDGLTTLFYVACLALAAYALLHLFDVV